MPQTMSGRPPFFAPEEALRVPLPPPAPLGGRAAFWSGGLLPAGSDVALAPSSGTGSEVVGGDVAVTVPSPNGAMAPSPVLSRFRLFAFSCRSIPFQPIFFAA